MAVQYYLDPANFTKFYDERRVQELLSDSGTEVAVGDIATDPLLEELIIAATGEINSVILQGRRYTVQNLQDIIEAADNLTDKMAQATVRVLNQLCADLVFGMLLARRGYGPEAMEKMAPRYKTALQTLEDLYQGKKVFNLSATIEAGVPQIVKIGGNGYRPTVDNKLFGIFWDSPLGGYWDTRSRMF
jgi:phage gp36-like protein